jgi:hypothetical protein
MDHASDQSDVKEIKPRRTKQARKVVVSDNEDSLYGDHAPPAPPSSSFQLTTPEPSPHLAELPMKQHVSNDKVNLYGDYIPPALPSSSSWPTTPSSSPCSVPMITSPSSSENFAHTPSPQLCKRALDIF